MLVQYNEEVNEAHVVIIREHLMELYSDLYEEDLRSESDQSEAMDAIARTLRFYTNPKQWEEFCKAFNRYEAY